MDNFLKSVPLEPGPFLFVRVRIISAREATRRERQQYENEPR